MIFKAETIGSIHFDDDEDYDFGDFESYDAEMISDEKVNTQQGILCSKLQESKL